MVGWPLQPLQPPQKTWLQLPFGQSADSLCHLWVPTTNPSYRFPIFETSAAALRGTTGIIYNNTSSTAQGGGGSFKNRKPIGEVGCCESRMAERIRWCSDRWLSSPLFLSLFLSFSLCFPFSDYLPTYLLIYLSFYLSIYLSIYLLIELSTVTSYLSLYLSSVSSIHSSIDLSIYLSISPSS